MTVFEYINQNKDQIEVMIKAGLLRYKSNFYFSLYSRYLYYLNFHNKTNAIDRACSDHCVCQMTGFRAIKEMEAEL
jgi:hypothetical protein